MAVNRIKSAAARRAARRGMDFVDNKKLDGSQVKKTGSAHKLFITGIPGVKPQQSLYPPGQSHRHTGAPKYTGNSKRPDLFNKRNVTSGDAREDANKVRRLAAAKRRATRFK